MGEPGSPTSPSSFSCSEGTPTHRYIGASPACWALYTALQSGGERALWLRREALQERTGPRRGRFSWLPPPDFAGSLTIAAIVREPTPAARSAAVARYVEGVYQIWERAHGATIAAWYATFVRRGP